MKSWIAIMADTDNSKLSSIAYYQNIYFPQINQYLVIFLDTCL